MLKRLGPSVVSAGETTSAALFPAGLEFNAPVHGTWNIVHIGMLVPEAHQIYVCALNCMRGVVLTAAEMGAQDRFSCVVLKEEDITRGTVEQITLDGIRDVLYKLEAAGKLPPCVLVFPVCTHLFLGVPLTRVYRKLEEEFPQVDFVRALMDPISKRRLIPDKRLRKVMYDPLPPCEPDERFVALLGSEFAPEADSDLRTLLTAGGKRLVSIHDCATYEEFKGLSRAATFVSIFPNGEFGARKTAERLGREHLYLPSTFTFDEIEQQELRLCQALDLPVPDFAAERAACVAELAKTRAVVGDAPVAVDAVVHPRPFGLARLLIEQGFNVSEVYLDGVNGEEEAELDWLRVNAPELQLSSTILPDLRVAPRTRGEKTLAIGPKAAWFTGSGYFVNMVFGGGLWGFAGVRTMARLMREAWAEEKDTRDLVPRKGLGCVSCI
ncbi:MAG: hypothetical protein IJI12_08390 [Atopobiaceae bacterium]|nr:hypothetical protein [Atopobiaceae bacterium]